MRTYKEINNVLGWIVCAIATTVYLITLEPTASFWDCGEFISSAYKLEVGHSPGAPFYILVGNLFAQLASDTSTVARMINSMSALSSGLTILFLFWTITHLTRALVAPDGDAIPPAKLIVIMGSGLVGALAYTFSDTFWFSAVEGEVYAFSSLFTAVVFWLILKWEAVADQPHADRYIVLIAYLMGLSIGVHLLNLLCIPAIVLVYYYKKFPDPTLKGTLLALLVSFAIIALMMYGVVQGLAEVCGYFELLFVNVLGMPYQSGVFTYLIILIGVLIWSVWETMCEVVHPFRLRISFLLFVVLSGIPFVGSGYIPAIMLTGGLGVWLFMTKKEPVKILNTVLLCLMVVVVGYASYAMILIRATADTPMNQNAPGNIFTLRTYLAREQYGETPLLYGQTYASIVQAVHKDGNYVAAIKEGAPTYSRIIKKDQNEKDRYFVSRTEQKGQYVDELNTLFPRMFSTLPEHMEGYKQWGQVKGEPVSFEYCGEKVTIVKPTFKENLRYFFSYQLNFMYWRYFMWNFSGRQNDLQGYGDLLKGNWITGIPVIDTLLIGPQTDMPAEMADNKGRNVYFLLPLLLGIAGLLYQVSAGKRGVRSFRVLFFLFFMTGLAIVLYLNQVPVQPRERDYAYVGSFYAFSIWIGFGVASVGAALERYVRLNPIAAGAVATALCLLVPVWMGMQNWDDHNRSGRTACRDFGANYLESCEPNAIIFTYGDNDTFPLWYAQEVEGIRTDVRVCNVSYLQTDWYIDQMKKQAYQSAPLPITWTRDLYIQGKRDFAAIHPLVQEPIDLAVALNFVRSGDPKFKKITGSNQEQDYIPSETLLYKVDPIAGANTLDGDTTGLLEEMTIDLKGKKMLGKQELTILDMLQTNNFERPLYYAITVSPEQFVGLDGYFEQTGLAYRIVPKNANKAVCTEKMYQNVMNKFRWGGVDKPGVYLDEATMRMCKNYRMFLFNKLAEALVNEGQLDKALHVLDKSMQVLPPENVPLDLTALSTGQLYYVLNERDKAEKIVSAIADDTLRNLNWFSRLDPLRLASVSGKMEENLLVLRQVLLISKHYNPEFGNKYQKEFDHYRMVFGM